MQKREFTDLKDRRLVIRGNKILDKLFCKSVHSIRQFTQTEADAKGCYRFLQNPRISEADILANMVSNCQAGCRGKFVVCLQDTTEINLSSHSRRIRKDAYIGTTNAKGEQGLGFFVHPSLVVDGQTGVPYGYSDVKIWNRPLEFRSKHQRQYHRLSMDQKESYKWIEVSRNTQSALADVVEGMVIVQDREGDIYEPRGVGAAIPDERTDLLIRCRIDRGLADGTKLFGRVSERPLRAPTRSWSRLREPAPDEQPASGALPPCGDRQNSGQHSNHAPATVPLYVIEAKETGYTGKDPICWRLLTTIEVSTLAVAKGCMQWQALAMDHRRV